MPRRFSFDLFRLNIVDLDDLFIDRSQPKLRSNKDIVEVLSESAKVEHDQSQQTRTALFRWSVRDYLNLSELSKDREIHHLVFARSAVEKDGVIVTDAGLSTGTSSFSPPLASAAICIFDLTRHLVAIEHTGELNNTAWKEFLEKIFSSASISLKKTSTLVLEPVPEANGIIGLFNSFDSLTRLKLTLVIPNPELTRYTKDLYDDLRKADIREITQDMKNPNGLAKNTDARPYASAMIAEQGYKKGDVQMEGFKDGEFTVATSGSSAAKGSVQGLRDYVRGIGSNAKTKETKQVIESIVNEIDTIVPIPSSEN